MPRLKNRQKLVNLFLRVPAEARAALEVEAEAIGQKPVVLARSIIADWAKSQNQKTPVA